MFAFCEETLVNVTFYVENAIGITLVLTQKILKIFNCTEINFLI